MDKAQRRAALHRIDEYMNEAYRIIAEAKADIKSSNFLTEQESIVFRYQLGVIQDALWRFNPFEMDEEYNVPRCLRK